MSSESCKRFPTGWVCLPDCYDPKHDEFLEPPTRDERWEHVFASVGYPQGYFYEDENQQFSPLELVEFLIEVQYGRNVLYSRIIVHKDDLTDSRISVYKFTLDKMVEQIDNYLAES